MDLEFASYLLTQALGRKSTTLLKRTKKEGSETKKITPQYLNRRVIFCYYFFWLDNEEVEFDLLDNSGWFQNYINMEGLSLLLIVSSTNFNVVVIQTSPLSYVFQEEDNIA